MYKQSPVKPRGFREDILEEGTFELSPKGKGVCKVTKV